MQDDVRSGYAFAEAVGSLQEWQLGEGESCIACRVLRIYDYLDGCAPLFQRQKFFDVRLIIFGSREWNKGGINCLYTA